VAYTCTTALLQHRSFLSTAHHEQLQDAASRAMYDFCFTPIYAAFLALAGLLGFLVKGSTASLGAPLLCLCLSPVSTDLMRSRACILAVEFLRYCHLVPSCCGGGLAHRERLLVVFMLT
jgi:hypothetical protein